MGKAEPGPLPPGHSTLGALSRQYRLAAGLTQEAPAERTGMSEQAPYGTLCTCRPRR